MESQTMVNPFFPSKGSSGFTDASGFCNTDFKTERMMSALPGRYHEPAFLSTIEEQEDEGQEGSTDAGPCTTA